jgi:hypothetical protein
MNRRSSGVFFFLFAVFWCLAITVVSGKENDSIDAASYRQQFEFWIYMDYNYFFYRVSNYFTFNFGEGTNKDIYSTLVLYWLTRLTDNYHVMFMFFGAVCSFFMLKTFHFFTREKKFDNSFSAFLLAVMFIMHNDIMQIWGVRFVTATWIALYATFQILRNENNKYLLLLCVTPLIHVTFFIYVSLFVVAFLTRKFETFYRVLFISSIAISTFATYFVTVGINLLPPALQASFSGYVDNAYKSEIENDFNTRNIFLQILIVLETLLTSTYILFLMVNRKKITYKLDYNIYVLLLIVAVFASVTSIVPSLGMRFFRLTYPLIAYLFLKYFNYGLNRILWYIYPFIFFHHFAKAIGISYLRTTSWEFYVSNPFYLIYKYLIVA